MHGWIRQTLPRRQSLSSTFCLPALSGPVRTRASGTIVAFSDPLIPSTRPIQSANGMAKKEKRPWYKEGLRFECTQCGICCSGEPGYVWVDQPEIDAMAGAMQLTVDEFEKQFIRKVGSDKSLKEYPDGDCILLDPQQRTCMVYQARPIQCRTWPFWDSTIETEKDWKETCEACPGAGKGKLYSFEEIEIERKKKSV